VEELQISQEADKKIKELCEKLTKDYENDPFDNYRNDEDYIDAPTVWLKVIKRQQQHIVLCANKKGVIVDILKIPWKKGEYLGGCDDSLARNPEQVEKTVMEAYDKGYIPMGLGNVYGYYKSSWIAEPSGEEQYYLSYCKANEYSIYKYFSNPERGNQQFAYVKAKILTH
jgi:Txe/YoeB family toxin of Txe-Axe toxin-antitoxin module